MKTLVMRGDPRRADAIHLRSGLALQAAVGAPKKLAPVAGISERLAQAWCAGDSRSPFARVGEVVHSMVQAGFRVWAVIGYLISEAYAGDMMTSEEALRARVRRLMRDETERQGLLDVLQVDCDLDDVACLVRIEELAQAHGHTLLELAAAVRMLRKALDDGRSNLRGGRAA